MASLPGSETHFPPGFAEIADAAARLAGKAVATPLLESEALNAIVGGRILVKAEVLQRTGSFKFRGAWNLISRLSEAQRRSGVVAYSSGNHAQGVAAACQLLDIRATIVMPSDAPAVKIAGTRSRGAEIVFYDRASEPREQITNAIAERSGAVIVPPYDHPLTIAGQGTVGLEAADQAAERGLDLDLFLAPCGGGGLIAGCAIAVHQRFPAARIYAVEPDEQDDTARSLASGRRESVQPGADSFCDALLAPIPGALTFAVNSRLLAGGLTVSEAETAAAMAAAFDHLKLVVEPSGAVALAAALPGKIDCRGKVAANVCSGGNVDAETFRRALDRHSPSIPP